MTNVIFLLIGALLANVLVNSKLVTGTARLPTKMDSPTKETLQPRRHETRRAPRRRWLPYAGALLLLALIVGGLWPKPLPVETVQIVSGSLRATVNEEGKTRIKQRYVVSAPVAGQLRRIPFKAGAEIMAGETVVAVIDPLSPVLLDARTRALAEARQYDSENDHRCFSMTMPR